MIKRILSIFASLAFLALAANVVPFALAQGGSVSKRSILTFSQPFEVPGKVLPAGTYVFKLLSSESNPHVVQIFSADESHLVWSCLAINDNRIKATDKTVMTFGETADGTPQPLRVWFYPGDGFGQEFVYPKRRAVQLAAIAAAPVPATNDDIVMQPEQLATATVADVLPPAPPVAAPVAAPDVAPAPVPAAPVETTALALPPRLPATASLLPLLALMGLLSLGLAFAVRRFA